MSETDYWKNEASINRIPEVMDGVFAFYRFSVVAFYAFENRLHLRIGSQVFPMDRTGTAEHITVGERGRIFRLRDALNTVVFETHYSLSRWRRRAMKDPILWKDEADYDFFQFVASRVNTGEGYEQALKWWLRPRVWIEIRDARLYVDDAHLPFPADVVDCFEYNRLIIVRLDASQHGERNIVALDESLQPCWKVETAPVFDGAPNLPGYSKVAPENGRLMAWTWRGYLVEVDANSGKLIPGVAGLPRF